MTSRESPAAPVRLALSELKTDARKLVETIQDAAVRLKASRRPRAAKSTGQPPPRASDNPPVNEALEAYQSKEALVLEEHHTRFKQEIQSVGRPVDEILEQLVSSCIRDGGVAATQVVSQIDAVRDWTRRLYAVEQLEDAMSLFYRAEVAYRAARIGLELSRPPAVVAAREIEGNRLNRQGTNALFHLSDHLVETSEALLPLAGAFEDLWAAPEAASRLDRQAFARSLSAALNAHHVYDDARYLIERGLETTVLVPYETGLEEALHRLQESVERLGSQRQSRERGWLPEEPSRDIHATAVSFWLLNAQLTTALVYAASSGTREVVAVETAPIAEELPERLLELMSRSVLFGIEVQRRLDYRDG